MPVETTSTRLRERLASVLDQVVNDQEVVIVRRRGAPDVALVPAQPHTCKHVWGTLATAHVQNLLSHAEQLLAEPVEITLWKRAG